MELRRRTDSQIEKHISVPTEFNDLSFQQSPIKLPRLSSKINSKHIPHRRTKNTNLQLPKIIEPNLDISNNLDGSQDLNQSQNYANSSDNMKDQINQIRKKMNLSKYSEKFNQSDASNQYIKEKHSQSSTHLRNSQTKEDKLLRSKKSSQNRRKSKIMSEANIQENRTIVTQTNRAESDISDFQQKIEANRAIIKNNKFKKNKQDKSIIKKINLFEKKTSNQILYQKRMKEYKNFSQNKYLKEKKKQITGTDLKNKQKEQQLKFKGRDLSRVMNTPPVRSRRQSPSVNSNAHARRYQNSGYQKIQNIKRRKSKLKQQILDEQPPNNYGLNQNLFTDINIILGNKHKSRSQFLSVGKLSNLSLNHNAKINKKVSLNIHELQKSFRILQQQQSILLGYKRDPQNLKLSINKGLIESSNLLQWQRVELSHDRKQLNVIQSNFMNEVDRINSFHQKNQQCLQAYLSNRQRLIELEIQNRLRQLSPGKSNRLRGQFDDQQGFKIHVES